MAARGLTLPCFSSSLSVSLFFYSYVGGTRRFSKNTVAPFCFPAAEERRGAVVLALRCCFAEINVAMAPSLWTRMQNNLGQIKPALLADIRRPARRFWCPGGKKGERARDQCNLAGVFAAAAGRFSGEKWARFHIVFGEVSGWQCCSTYRLNEDTFLSFFLIQFPKWNLPAGMNFKQWLIFPK